MNRLEKAFLILLSVFALCLSAVIFFIFYPLAPFTQTIQNYQTLYPVINSMLAIFGGVLSVGFLLLILFVLAAPKRSDTMTMHKEKNQLQFSKRAIESTVRCSFQEVAGIHFAKVRVKIHKVPEKSKVFVKLSAKDPFELMLLSQTVKEKIEAALLASLELTVQSINIKVTSVNTASKGQQAPQEEPEPDHTRVV